MCVCTYRERKKGENAETFPAVIRSFVTLRFYISETEGRDNVGTDFFFSLSPSFMKSIEREAEY
jgi:hypothetical protein